MSQPYLGQIMLFAGAFAPLGYLPCDGRVLAISEYDDLFVLLGATFGGDGVNTFALPDLRGRVSVGMGTGAGLPNYVIGQTGGTEQVTLASTQAPSHTHAVATTAAPGSTNTPGPTTIFADQDGDKTVKVYAPYNSSGQTALASGSMGVAGGSGSHENRQPYLTITICIAVQGDFPQRS